MDEEIKSFLKVWLTILASMLYCYFIASKFPKGKLRLFSLLPIFSLYISSLSTSPPFSSLASLPSSSLGFQSLNSFSFPSIWVLSHLTHHYHSFSLSQLPASPIRIKHNEKYPNDQNHEKVPDQSPKLPLNLPLKIMLLAILVSLNNYSKQLHQNIILCIYCAMVYLLVDILLGLSNELARSTLGIELERPSNEPYVATSLQDFWGRRWNLLVSNTLRYSIYKPVRSAAGSVMGPRWAAATALLAAFVVSGLMHELLFFYMMGVNPTWEVTWFFVLHGVCVLVEFGLKAVLGKSWRLHWVVSGPFTVAFVVVTAAWLFFPPLLRNGAVDGALKECTAVVEFVQAQFGLVLECVGVL